MKTEILIESIFVALLLLISGYMYTSDFAVWGSTVFHVINLVFHEAGHVIFIFFGGFMSVLGGSLTEILVPLLIALYFHVRKETMGVVFALWWLSTALYSVSIYAGDAGTRLLPLITGEPTTHDWHYILQTLGILQHDNLVGGTFLLASVFSLVSAVMVFFNHIQHKRSLYEVPPHHDSHKRRRRNT